MTFEELCKKYRSRLLRRKNFNAMAKEFGVKYMYGSLCYECIHNFKCPVDEVFRENLEEYNSETCVTACRFYERMRYDIQTD